jgi:hypothetical protein
MAIQCIGRRMSGGNGHEHISEIRWRDDSDGSTGHSTRATMVTYVETNGNEAVYCTDAAGRKVWVQVGSNGSTRYIRTAANGKWADNLLALPLF